MNSAAGDQGRGIDPHAPQHMVPHQRRVHFENDIATQRSDQPGPLGEFRLELPGSPARVAEQEVQVVRQVLAKKKGGLLGC